jgi:molybdopterin-guanine dinucleotide biosynthesis protein A
MSIGPADITGLILAGGRGSRMGGVDKGLQCHLGVPLALHALRRLAPQVATVMINANRNLASYEAMGVPVWPDATPDFSGPLAGMLAGLTHCQTPYLAAVPCDTPNFPLDLIARLARGLEDLDGEIAIAATREDGALRAQPVFCLMRASLRESLTAFIESGERRTGLWSGRQRCAQVVFEEASAFFNLNTLAELEQLQIKRR